MAESQRISRLGSYGLVIQDNKVLLTNKKSGPYLGLWDLPGGAIEFGETPETALIREILEETASAAKTLTLFDTATFTGTYAIKGVMVKFHHIGILFQVADITPVEHAIPEEEVRWVNHKNLNLDELTPIAKAAIMRLNSGTPL